MHPDHLLPGTLIWRKDVHLGLVDHYGVIVAQYPCTVANIDKSPLGKLNIKIEAFAEFAANRPVSYEPLAEAIDLNVMWNRINEVARSYQPFGLLCWGRDWNCESFARYVRDGIPHSTQASKANQFLAGAAMFSVPFLIAAAALNEGDATVKYDRSVGRYRDQRGRFASR